MATEIKTLASGVLRNIGASFARGEKVLYAAPHPSEILFPATAKKTAMITGMRFFNSSTGPGPITLALRFVRFDLSTQPAARDQINALPYPTLLNPGELRVETTPLILEEGDLIIGFAGVTNYVHYIISGIEREV